MEVYFICATDGFHSGNAAYTHFMKAFNIYFARKVFPAESC